MGKPQYHPMKGRPALENSMVYTCICSIVNRRILHISYVNASSLFSLLNLAAVIYPSLQQLEADLTELEDPKQRGRYTDKFGRKGLEERRKLTEKDSDREDECGICMEVCTKIVLPTCNHAMCITCYRDW